MANQGNNVTVYVANAFVNFDKLELNNRLKIRSIPARLQKVFPPALIPFMPGLAHQKELGESDIIQSAEFYNFSTFSSANLAARKHVPFFIWQEAYHYMRPPAKPFQQIYNFTIGKSIEKSTTKLILRTKKAKLFLKEIGIPNSAIGPWIPTGIKADLFKEKTGKLSPEAFGFPKDHTLILLIARLTPSKGVDLALQAQAILRRKKLKTALLIRGSGPELDNLKALARHLQIHDSVRFIGPQTKRQLATLYRSADIYLLSSREDLFPFTVLEAAACGLPSVATNVGCVEDSVADGINGLLTLPNPVQIAAALEKLVNDHELRRALGKQAQAVFMQTFEMGVVAHRFIDYYKSFL
jgi:glycosyltransferase involved in cell wall biosynthesis